MKSEIKRTVSVCILNRDAVGMLRDCLTSLEENCDEPDLKIQVIVVDNASSDGSAQMARREFPEVTLIENTYNAGFAEGNNQAIRVSKGEIIVLLNNDTVVTTGALSRLVSAMQADPSVAIAGGRLLNPDGTTQLSYYKIDLPSASSLVRELFFVDRWWPNNPWFRRSGAAHFNPDRLQEMGQVPGAFMAIRRDFLQNCGLLDERFYYWYEDVELCHRASQSGWKVLYVPEARIVHLGGATFNSVLLSEKSKWRYASMRKYIALTFPPLQAAVTETAIILSLLVRIPAFYGMAVISAGDKKWFQAARASSLILREVLFSR